MKLKITYCTGKEETVCLEAEKTSGGNVKVHCKSSDNLDEFDAIITKDQFVDLVLTGGYEEY